MKRIILAPVFLISLILGACTLEVQPSSPQANIEPAIIYSYTGDDGKQYRLEKRSEYFDPQGFIVRNIKYCNNGHIGWYGYYDWYDYNADYTIKEAWCFDPKNGLLDESSQTLYGVLSDEWGTYYGDKEGGAYNVRRITTVTGAEIVPFTASGYGDLPLIHVGGEYFLYWNKLEGLTDMDTLKTLPTISGEFLITDWQWVWNERVKIEVNPDTAYEKESGLIVDDSRCFFYDYFLGLNKINNCDPKTIRFLSGSRLSWSPLLIDKHGCYTREQKLEWCNPEKVRFITYTSENMYDQNAWKKMKYWSEWKQTAFSDGINNYDSEGNLLEAK